MYGLRHTAYGVETYHTWYHQECTVPGYCTSALILYRLGAAPDCMS